MNVEPNYEEPIEEPEVDNEDAEFDRLEKEIIEDEKNEDVDEIEEPPETPAIEPEVPMPEEKPVEPTKSKLPINHHMPPWFLKDTRKIFLNDGSVKLTLPIDFVRRLTWQHHEPIILKIDIENNSITLTGSTERKIECLAKENRRLLQLEKDFAERDRQEEERKQRKQEQEQKDKERYEEARQKIMGDRKHYES